MTAQASQASSQNRFALIHGLESVKIAADLWPNQALIVHLLRFGAFSLRLLVIGCFNGGIVLKSGLLFSGSSWQKGKRETKLGDITQLCKSWLWHKAINNTILPYLTLLLICLE